MTRQLILGPPGTGKTTTCIGKVIEELERGVPEENIAFVAFNKAATEDVRRRVMAQCPSSRGPFEEYPWFRTIHATAFRLLGITHGKVMDDARWAEFGNASGYQLSAQALGGIDDVPIAPMRTPHDQLRALYDWGRNRRLPLAGMLARSTQVVSTPEFMRFVDSYRKFKAANGVVDFVDMLERALACADRSPVEVAFIDEAQDLSPLQVALVDHWFRNCDRVYVAGDDDQSIYEFQGADSAWLIKFAKTATVVSLTESRRVPRAVHGVAQAIIRRNTHRIPKTYRPRDADGRVEQLDLRAALGSLEQGRPAFVLARNRAFLGDVVAELRRQDQPYLLEGGHSPFALRHGLVAGARAALALDRGEAVQAGDLGVLVRVLAGRNKAIVSTVARKDIEALSFDDVVRPERLRRLLQGCPLGAAITTGRVLALLRRARPDDVEYVLRVFAKLGEQVAATTTLTTIHRAKGREADTVIVLPAMTRATYANLVDQRRGGAEAEARVAYVAATRAKERLVICHPSAKLAFLYPAGRHR